LLGKKAVDAECFAAKVVVITVEIAGCDLGIDKKGFEVWRVTRPEPEGKSKMTPGTERRCAIKDDTIILNASAPTSK